MLKINILGEEYTLSKKPTGQGVDYDLKEIVINEENPKTSIFAENQLIRHEIIKAFLVESGLGQECEWAQNRSTTDWFARQLPKIGKLCQTLGLFDNVSPFLEDTNIVEYEEKEKFNIAPIDATAELSPKKFEGALKKRVGYTY